MPVSILPFRLFDAPALTAQVNSMRIAPRRILVHGDEICIGLSGTTENHDVRYIFRSVGSLGTIHKSTDRVGGVFEQYQILQEYVAESKAVC